MEQAVQQPRLRQDAAWERRLAPPPGHCQAAVLRMRRDSGQIRRSARSHGDAAAGSGGSRRKRLLALRRRHQQRRVALPPNHQAAALWSMPQLYVHARGPAAP